MSHSTYNNKKIIKNTLLLYIRMFLMMIVSLYTVRVILNTLGTTDYGIFDLVSGVVTMFAFISGTMSSSSQRFFSIEIGKKDYKQLRNIFSLTMFTYIVISIIVLIIAETLGLWFLNYKMVIPINRIEAANWIFQFSILSFIITMITIPYNAIIIAHERMNVFAYISIVEVVLKLVIVYILTVIPFDKLKVYSILLFFVSSLINLIYRIYCKNKFKECSLVFYWEIKTFKNLMTFSSWNIFNSMTSIFSIQGINIILGMFLNPAVNAARGIAYQVSVTMNQFVLNFITATKPQIIKNYISENIIEMKKLVFRTSKFSFLLLFIVTMPILLETEYIFTIWLKTVPKYLIPFTRLLIISILIDVISYPFLTVIQANGRVNTVYIIIGFIRLTILPISYIILKNCISPEIIFILLIIISIISLFIWQFFLKSIINYSIKKFTKSVLLPLILIVITSYILPIIILYHWDSSLYRTLSSITIGFICSIISIYILGITKNEKQFLKEIIILKIKKQQK